MDRFSGGRDWPGAIDDVNLYSGALTQSQIDSIQIASVPEPSAFAMISVGFIGLIAVRRRRSKLTLTLAVYLNATTL